MTATELRTERLTERVHEVLSEELIHGWTMARQDMTHFGFVHDDGTSFAVDYDAESDGWTVTTETGHTVPLESGQEVVDLVSYVQARYGR